MRRDESMLKIGDFAQVGQVTVKTLHYYDRVGLLQPTFIDESNSYRYYTVEQLARLHRILALKDLGLSLEQIGRMLSENVPTEQIRGMLRLRQSELQDQLREASRQLSMVEFRLRMIDAETNFPNLDVVIKRLEPMRFLSKMARISPNEEAGQDEMVRVAEGLKQAINDGLIYFTGVTFDVFHGETILPLESTELEEGQHEILIGVTPAQQPVTLQGMGHWIIKEAPEIPEAATLVLMHNDLEMGPFEKVALLRRWAVAHGYRPGGLVRYLHHRGPMQTFNRAEFILEAQLPLGHDGEMEQKSV